MFVWIYNFILQNLLKSSYELVRTSKHLKRLSITLHLFKVDRWSGKIVFKCKIFPNCIKWWQELIEWIVCLGLSIFSLDGGLVSWETESGGWICIEHMLGWEMSLTMTFRKDNKWVASIYNELEHRQKIS